MRADRTPFYTPERCFISEWFNTADSPAASLAQCRVEPGITTQLHALTVTERYIVTDGQGLMELDRGAPFEIKPGDTVTIPADCPQRVRNTGTQDLIFLCLCTPRFEPDQYINLENDDTPALEEPMMETAKLETKDA